MRRSEFAKRDEVIQNAIKAGKIPPARREHYANLYDLDPRGHHGAPGQPGARPHPLDELGYGDAQDAVQDDAYDMSALTPRD